jgi:preprotein translocase subunit YajC
LLLTFGSRFYPPTFAPLYQTLSHGIFFFSSKRKGRKKKEKNHKKEKKIERKEKVFFQALAPPSHFWLPLLPFYYTCFFLASYFSQVEEKKTKTKEKNHREEKNAKKGGNLLLNSCLALSLLALTFDLVFLPFCFKRIFLGIFFFSSIKKQKKTQKKKKTIEKKKNAEKGGNLPFFSCFYIWDETFLLLFPLHIPSTLSFPPSSSLVSHVSLKRCATQAHELF